MDTTIYNPFNWSSIMTFAFSSIFLLASSQARADIYEYIHEDGQISYSDTPIDDRYVLIIHDSSSPSSKIDEAIKITPDQTIVPSMAQLPITTPAELLRHINVVSNKHKVDPDLIHAVIHVESAYRQYAKSNKGAIGLMQLLPATAKRMGVTDIYNPAQNIDGGTKYLRHLLNMFNNDTRLALAAYNAGEQSVLRFGKRIPPFKETQAYVPKVMQVYEALQKQRAQMLLPL